MSWHSGIYHDWDIQQHPIYKGKLELISRDYMTCGNCKKTCFGNEECLKYGHFDFIPANRSICEGCPMFGNNQCCRQCEPCFRRIEEEAA